MDLIADLFPVFHKLFRDFVITAFGIAPRLWAGQPRSLRSIPGRGKIFFLFSITSRSAWGPTHPPIQTLLGAVSPAAKRQGRVPSSAEVRKGGAMPPLPHTSLWIGAYLSNFGDNFTLPLP
jgi:hypothetical protein